LGQPSGNLGLIAFFCGWLGLLAGEVHRLQEMPDVTWVMGDPGQLFDQLADARQCPQRRLEPMRLRTVQQGISDLLKLLVAQGALATGPTHLERFDTLGLPDLIPFANAHAADVQAAANLGIR
jgi:hypothetical protein